MVSFYSNNTLNKISKLLVDYSQQTVVKVLLLGTTPTQHSDHGELEMVPT